MVTASSNFSPRRCQKTPLQPNSSAARTAPDSHSRGITALLKPFCASTIFTGEVVTPASVETNEGETDRLQSVVGSDSPPPQPINVQAIARSERTRFPPVASSNASPEDSFRRRDRRKSSRSEE